MSRLRFGVLGTANIGKNQVNPAIRQARNASLASVASRDEAKAQAFAEAHGFERHHVSYEALVADPEIDAVYIPLPNSIHREWTVRAAEKGKHILCEKPLATSVAEAREMQAAADANGVVLMEAFMYRFHPRTVRLLELAKPETIGDLRMIRSSFVVKLASPTNIRFYPELGGGVLRDLGCYCIDISRRIAGAEPLEAQAFATWNERDVDVAMTATLRFPNDVAAQFDCSFLMERREFVEAAGLLASVSSPAETFVNSVDTVEILERRNRFADVHHPVKGDNHYRLMVEHFADAVMGKVAPRYGIADSLGNLAVIDALYASARSGGRPVAVERLA